jgi:hypothetical protein
MHEGMPADMASRKSPEASGNRTHRHLRISCERHIAVTPALSKPRCVTQGALRSLLRRMDFVVNRVVPAG